jgi:hypothetical protein
LHVVAHVVPVNKYIVVVILAQEVQVLAVPPVHVRQKELQESHVLPEVFPQNPVGQVAGQVLVAAIRKKPVKQVVQFVAVVQALQGEGQDAHVFAVLL